VRRTPNEVVRVAPRKQNQATGEFSTEGMSEKTRDSREDSESMRDLQADRTSDFEKMYGGGERTPLYARAHTSTCSVAASRCAQSCSISTSRDVAAGIFDEQAGATTGV
jgi:hypothetical protein